jgi:hypothetical protein
MGMLAHMRWALNLDEQWPVTAPAKEVELADRR